MVINKVIIQIQTTPKFRHWISFCTLFNSCFLCQKYQKIVVSTMQIKFKMNFTAQKSNTVFSFILPILILSSPPNSHLVFHFLYSPHPLPLHPTPPHIWVKTTVWFSFDLLSLCECFLKEVRLTDKNWETLRRRGWGSTSKSIRTSCSLCSLPSTCGNTVVCKQSIPLASVDESTWRYHNKGEKCNKNIGWK